MKFEEYRRQDAISLAGLITKREVSAMEVLETAIARAEQIKLAINSPSRDGSAVPAALLRDGRASLPANAVALQLAEHKIAERGAAARFPVRRYLL